MVLPAAVRRLEHWALALVVLVIVGSAAKTSYNSSFVVPGTGSAKAIGLLQKLLPTASGDQDTVVWHVATAVILFLAYGSLLAMLLPLITAIFGLGCGLMVVGLLSRAMSVASLAPSLAVLVGLGVCIDYALVIVTRYRGRLLQGDAPEDAAARALSTAGRAVLIAAGTVCIALLGMLVLGMPYLNGVAIAATVVVLLMVASAETLLPALFGILRLRVLSRRPAQSRARGNCSGSAGTWAPARRRSRSGPVSARDPCITTSAASRTWPWPPSGGTWRTY